MAYRDHCNRRWSSLRKKATELSTDPRHALGRTAENQALVWLERQGLSLVTRNWRGHRGELDLVMREQDTLVVVEVRARPGRSHPEARASIGPAKARRLRATVRDYLGASGFGDELPVRIDVVTLAGNRACPDLHWWRAAL